MKAALRNKLPACSYCDEYDKCNYFIRGFETDDYYYYRCQMNNETWKACLEEITKEKQ